MHAHALYNFFKLAQIRSYSFFLGCFFAYTYYVVTKFIKQDCMLFIPISFPFQVRAAARSIVWLVMVLTVSPAYIRTWCCCVCNLGSAPRELFNYYLCSAERFMEWSAHADKFKLYVYIQAKEWWHSHGAAPESCRERKSRRVLIHALSRHF